MRLLLTACLCLAVLSSSPTISQDRLWDQQLKPYQDINPDHSRTFQLAVIIPNSGIQTGRWWLGIRAVADDPFNHRIGNSATSKSVISTGFRSSLRDEYPSSYPPRSIIFDHADQQYNISPGKFRLVEMFAPASDPNGQNAGPEAGVVLRALRSMRIDFQF